MGTVIDNRRGIIYSLDIKCNLKSYSTASGEIEHNENWEEDLNLRKNRLHMQSNDHTVEYPLLLSDDILFYATCEVVGAVSARNGEKKWERELIPGIMNPKLDFVPDMQNGGENLLLSDTRGQLRMYNQKTGDLISKIK